MKQAMLVIYRSPNGRDNWQPIGQQEVPAFVMREDVMGHLVAGEMCQDAADGDKGSDWYMAVKVKSECEIAAEQKRMRKAEFNKKILDAEIERYKPKNLGPFLSGVQAKRLPH